MGAGCAERFTSGSARASGCDPSGLLTQQKSSPRRAQGNTEETRTQPQDDKENFGSLVVARCEGEENLLLRTFLVSIPFEVANHAGEDGVLRLRSAMPHSAQDDKEGVRPWVLSIGKQDTNPRSWESEIQIRAFSCHRSICIVVLIKLVVPSYGSPGRSHSIEQ
jgi:hypothetical protein